MDHMDHMDPFGILTLVLSVIAIALTIMTAYLIMKKHEKTKRITQIEFVAFLLAGIFLTSVGALLMVVGPRKEANRTCVASIWAIVVGYAWQIVPLIIKSRAIVEIVRASKKMRRVQVDKKMLLISSSLWSGFAMLYCTFWTLVDPPQMQQDGDMIYYCSWGSPWWTAVFYAALVVCYMQLGYLASKMSEAPQSVSDSKEIADMIYSSSISLAFRVIVYILTVIRPTGHLEKGTMPSFFFASEMIINLSVYFVQFFLAHEKPARRPMCRRSNGVRFEFSTNNSNLSGARATSSTKANASESVGPSSFAQSTVTDDIREEQKLEEGDLGPSDHNTHLSNVAGEKRVHFKPDSNNGSREITERLSTNGKGHDAEEKLESNLEDWNKEISDILDINSAGGDEPEGNGVIEKSCV